MTLHEREPFNVAAGVRRHECVIAPFVFNMFMAVVVNLAALHIMNDCVPVSFRLFNSFLTYGD